MVFGQEVDQAFKDKLTEKITNKVYFNWRTDAGTIGDTNDEDETDMIRITTSKLFASSSLSNQNNPQCNLCNHYYTTKQFSYTNLEFHVYKKKENIHSNCSKKSQFDGQQGQNFWLFNLMIRIV